MLEFKVYTPDDYKEFYREVLLRKVNKDVNDRLKYFAYSDSMQQEIIFLVLMEKNKKIVAATGISQSPYDSSVIWTHFTCTDPEYRNQGLSKRLIRHRFDYMREVYPGKSLKTSSFTFMGSLFIKKNLVKIRDKEYPDINLILGETKIYKPKYVVDQVMKHLENNEIVPNEFFD